MKRIFFILVLILIIGCVQIKDFNYGVKQIDRVNAKYNTSMDTYPKNIDAINSLINDLKELKKVKLDNGQEQFYYLVNYRMLNLEAERFFIEGQKYGSLGTTKDGFGCKLRPLIIESVALRNQSALKGFEAIDLLREFARKYPEEALTANLSDKNALFLNATFYSVFSEARRDSNIINNFCPVNRTLELYQEEFRKKTNYTEDFISSLTYAQAVNIWKKLKEIE